MSPTKVQETTAEPNMENTIQTQQSQKSIDSQIREVEESKTPNEDIKDQLEDDKEDFYPPVETITKFEEQG